ncbi:DUF956 family protein [Oenococcus sp.]|uniref:DUF956 family protein n=1 Tax=Oenococcus sp. TaxID=1979414 RepID=UPI0039E77919
MVQSLNSKVDLVIPATSFLGLSEYGKIMIGNKGFEFYNEKDLRKYIQIPWKDVNYVIASVMFKGKWIPRYTVQTNHNGSYTFASRQPQKVLKAMQKYVKPGHMVRSLTFFQVIRRGIKALFSRKKA